MSKVQESVELSDTVKPVFRIKNWSEYNKALEQRGNLMLYIDPTVFENWYAPGSSQQGGQFIYSDHSVQFVLTFKILFGLTYRAARGFVESLLSLMGHSHLKVMSCSQACRRLRTLSIPDFDIPHTDKMHLAIDSTGLKIYGEGEWKCRKHGVGKRRTWRKLHLAVDTDTHYIHAHVTTTNSEGDAAQLPELLEQVSGQVEEVSADGAYDTAACYEECIERNISLLTPPREGAVEWCEDQPGDMKNHPRNIAVRRVDEASRKQWKVESGYHKRSISETAMMRVKTIFSGRCFSRLLSSQRKEISLKIYLLNLMTSMGMPISVRVGT